MIIIPMAGEGSRFKRANYKIEKFKLTLGNYSLFQRSILSFKNYFNITPFVIGYRSEQTSKRWLKKQLSEIGLNENIFS